MRLEGRENGGEMSVGCSVNDSLIINPLSTFLTLVSLRPPFPTACVCVRVCVRACVSACMRACVCSCACHCRISLTASSVGHSKPQQKQSLLTLLLLLLAVVAVRVQEEGRGERGAPARKEEHVARSVGGGLG